MRFRRIHGYQRAFVHLGDGPALLLIHGIGDCCDTWGEIIPGLARDHTVIAPDLLGHGRSDKPRADYSVAAYANAMRDLLSVLGVERATVVGHSLGGGVAMQFAYQYPERCERLVLVATGGISREVHPLLRLAAAPNGDPLLPLLGLGPTRAIGGLVLAGLRCLRTDLGRDTADLERIFDALPDELAVRAFVRTLRGVVDWRGAMLGSRLEVFDDAGHFPHHHDPLRFVALLRDFLATTAPASYSNDDWRDLLRRGRELGPAPTPATASPASRPARRTVRARRRSRGTPTSA